jgi:membrane protease YdiL (CAAX protease family)
MSKRKAAFWILMVVLIPLSLSLFFSNFYIAIWYAKTAHRGPPPMDVIRKGVLYMTGFGLWSSVALLWLLKRKQDRFSILFGTQTKSLTRDVSYGLLLGIFWVLVYGMIGWPPFSSMFVISSAKATSLFTSVSTGFCEEFLFRGFAILLIARAGGRFKSQLIWSSLAFGIAHIFWGPVGMLFTIAMGLTFGAITLKRGNVWSAVTAHTFLNICIEPALLEKVLSMMPH